MKVLVIDITSTMSHYDFQLCDKLNEQCNIDVTLASAIKDEGCKYKLMKLFRIPLPVNFDKSTNKFKRYIRALESLLNYLYVAFKIVFVKYDIIHFQHFPFLMASGIEARILRFYRIISPKSKYIWTIHVLPCIVPGNVIFSSWESADEKYRDRLIKTSGFLDGFIVHTQMYIDRLKEFYGIMDKPVSVIFGGTYIPKNAEIKIYREELSKPHKFKLLHYGGLDSHKGTDIFVEALTKLTTEDKDRIQVDIVGGMDKTFYKVLREKAEGLNINWTPHFVPDDFLYDALSKTDAAVFPYRDISFSAALLLSIYFEKPIIASNIPAFVESLDGFDNEWFFISGDSDCLALKLSEYINHKIDTDAMVEVVCRLKQKYTWENTAKNTVEMYNKMLKSLIC
jgi:glycosyltransferase involved in cell wall biosynthesis